MSESALISRNGWFWDFLAGRKPAPAAAVTLGWELSWIAPERGEIEVFFDASEKFANPMGNIQGGFLAAMLDDTLGPALVATLDDGEFAPTLELKVSFLRPAAPGRLVGMGRVVHRGGSIAFLLASCETRAAMCWQPRRPQRGSFALRGEVLAHHRPVRAAARHHLESVLSEGRCDAGEQVPGVIRRGGVDRISLQRRSARRGCRMDRGIDQRTHHAAPAVRAAHVEAGERPHGQVVDRLEESGARQPSEFRTRSELAPADSRARIEGKQPGRPVRFRQAPEV
jgi:uncharacterized protein (TIGR00369 family)